MENYFQIKALSHSLIVACRDYGCLEAYKHSAFCEDEEEKLPTDAFEQGQLYHCLVQHPEIVADLDSYTNYLPVCLNPESNKPKNETMDCISVDDTTVIYVYPFGLSRKNKEYTKIVQWLKDNNKFTDDAIVCNKEELQNTCSMLKKLFGTPHYLAIQTLDKVSDEEPILFEIDGFPCKAKPDSLYKAGDNYLIVDWKTTRNFTREQNQLCGEKLGYHVEDFMYRTAVSKKYGVPLKNVQMCYIMQNKERPEIVYRCKFNDASFQMGETTFYKYAREFMDRLAKIPESGDWAFYDMCGELEFAHFEEKLLEQPDF